MEKITFVTYQQNYLKEYSNDYLKRCIWWDKKNSELGQKFIDSMSNVRKKLNLIIQELNLRIARNIPYMEIGCVEYVTKNTRIVFIDNNKLDDNNIMIDIDGMQENLKDLSHIIDCFQAAGRALMKKNNHTINNQKVDGVSIYFDNFIRELTIIDILLDIAFFNSYSFLRELSLEERKEFSRRKFEFYKKERLQTVFEEHTSDDLGYYSLAFSCHIPHILDKDRYEYEIDLDKYIRIWERFINTYYPDRKHKEISVEEQIKRRKNNHIPKDYYHEFDDAKPGIYYILRTEEKNISPDYVKYVLSIFGKEDMTVAHLKIIEAKDFDKYVELYKNAGVSVFKIVVQ